MPTIVRVKGLLTFVVISTQFEVVTYGLQCPMSHDVVNHQQTSCRSQWVELLRNPSPRSRRLEPDRNERTDRVNCVPHQPTYRSCSGVPDAGHADGHQWCPDPHAGIVRGCSQATDNERGKTDHPTQPDDTIAENNEATGCQQSSAWTTNCGHFQRGRTLAGMG